MPGTIPITRLTYHHNFQLGSNISKTETRQCNMQRQTKFQIAHEKCNGQRQVPTTEVEQWIRYKGLNKYFFNFNFIR